MIKPEHIDYSVASSDPADVMDECVHTSDDGPHAHRGKKKKAVSHEPAER